MTFRRVLILILLLVGTSASAQAIRIGVVVDRTGAGASAAMEAVLAAFQTRARTSGGVFGVPFEVIVRDDRGDPARTRAEVEQLIAQEGVHAVVCCSGSATARVAASLAQASGTLVLTAGMIERAPAGWAFTLEPAERTELRAIVSHAYAEGKRALALMTLSNAFGDLATQILEEELGAAGLELVATERYRPDASVLTPEALWVATRQPGAVVVWGLSADSGVAIDALRRRGYGGPIYARSDAIAAAGPGIDAGLLGGVRFAVAPISVDDGPLAGDPTFEAAASLTDFVLALYGIRDVPADAARMYDGLDLLRAAAEQAAVYGVSPESVSAYRVALRDAAIALPPFAGAGGSYDLDERTNQAALPAGLVLVEVRAGRRVAVVP